MIFELMLVFATFFKASFPRFSTLVDNDSGRYFVASRNASLYPLIIVVGWIRFFTNSFARRRSSAAIMTTLVVPSPTSLSCCWASSIKIRPAGCSTSNNDRIVAPSFVTVTSYVSLLQRSTPISSTSILSSPTGPNEDFTTLEIDCVARTH
jgi:hypothetical protein